MKKKTVLVTGAAGFLGSHLCDALVKDGDYVIGLDNFYTGSTDNITQFKDTFNFEMIRQDITSPIYLEVDEIYNLACPASPVHYQRTPVQTVKTIVHGAINVLELAKQTGAKILQASTSEIYGSPEQHPQTESYWGNVNPVGLRSCYDEGKRCAETLFTDYHRQYGVDTRIVRIFNAYGPRMQPDDGRVISNFITAALKNQPLVVHGDGQQTRSFCYVDDMIRGLRLAMEKRFPTPINLGNPDENTIMDIAKVIIQKTESNSNIIGGPMPPDDPPRRKPDITKAQKVLGWEPIWGLNLGLDKTIGYFAGLIC